MHTHTAIEGVCAWPNLTLLPDGTIVAAIFNQPCHGLWEGDLDCWASEDNGSTWQFRGRIAAHEPGTNRMNCAVGLTQEHDLLALVSGWSYRDKPGIPRGHQTPAAPLRTWVCSSQNGGRSWNRIGELPESNEVYPYIPFGDLQIADDGALCVSVYISNSARDGFSAYLLRSYDRGSTWGDRTSINQIGDETAILHLAQGRWLAASRHMNRDLTLFTSTDDARSWQEREALTQRLQIPGHLLRLQDGRIILSYGDRRQDACGVEAKVSVDDGRTWGTPIRLASMPRSDGGYPSSVQLSDGTIVTAYYAQLPGDYQYEINVVQWGL